MSPNHWSQLQTRFSLHFHHIYTTHDDTLHHAMVKIQIYTTFTPRCGENWDLHDIYTMLWWKVRFSPCRGEKSDFHHAMVKSQIYTMASWKVRFSPCHGEKSYLHHAVVKSQIFTTPLWKVRFTPHCGKKSDLHDIFTTHVGIFMIKFTPQCSENWFTCGENSFVYTTCGENCQSNVVVTFSVISKIGPTFLMSQLQLKIFQYVVKIILLCHLVLKK